MRYFLGLIFAVTPLLSAFSQDFNRLRCDVYNGRIRVLTEAGRTIEKSYSSAEDQQLVSCRANIAVGIMGSYFVYLEGDSIKDKYIGISSDERVLAVTSGKDSGAAVMGSYFISLTNGEIEKNYIGISSGERRIRVASGNNIVGAIMGDYFVVAANGDIEKKYIGISSDEHRLGMAAGRNILGAIMGDYFVVSHNGEIEKKYIGYSGVAKIRARGQLIAAHTGSYFVVFDGITGDIKKKYIGSDNAKLVVNRDFAILKTSSRDYVYSLLKNDFE